MTIREECFPGTAFAGCTGYPFPTLSLRAQREIFFVSPFASSFAKPFIGSTAHRLSAIRCFPFLAVRRAPSYRQRKRSLGFARDDDTERTHFPHTLCMMHGVFILHTIISSVARNGNTGRTFSQRTLYTIQRISIPPHCHFERSEKSFSSPFSTTPSLSRLRETPPPPFLQYGVSRFSLPNTRPLAANKKDPSLSMTIRGISPYHAQKSPSQS